MVVMAVWLGCDFVPAGVAGVGKETVEKLFAKWDSSWDAVKYLKYWIATDFAVWTGCSNCCESFHCERCELWQDNLAVPDCLCSRLEKDKDMVKLETGIKKKCQKMEPSLWSDEFPQVRRTKTSFNYLFYLATLLTGAHKV